MSNVISVSTVSARLAPCKPAAKFTKFIVLLSSVRRATSSL